jgi:nicotinate-nucleotide--dimethylbenzimidazole phosphoribosyltransferase
MNRASTILEEVGPLDDAAMAAASRQLDRLTKPAGSLGRLEDLVVWLAGVTGRSAPLLERRAVIVAAADHGVASRHAVSAYPAEVTAQMVANFVAGGAAISVLARAAAARLIVVDAGVASPIPPVVAEPGVRLVRTPIRPGSADMTLGPALSAADVAAAIEVGIAVAEDEIEAGLDVLAIGDMGIGNTTAASAITAALTGLPTTAVTGRGTGIDEHGWERKVSVIDRALEVNRASLGDPLGVLAAVGGLEIAVLVGVIEAAAGACVPVVLDGFITSAAALVVCELNPRIAPRLIAAHRSAEPGHTTILERLGLRPLLELDLRLGEGSGAALALLVLDAASRIRDEMATFDAAGVSRRTVL